MIRRPPWSEWLTVVVAGIAILVSVWAGLTARAAARSAERQAIASQELVEETRAPVLDVIASYVRTPVPDPSPFTQARGFDPDSFQLRFINNFLNSSGVWHVKVQNNGDAVATNVRIRAPGIFYARYVGYATGRQRNWKEVQNEEFLAEDLAPGQLISVVFWVLPEYTLADACGPMAGSGCFTKHDLKVFADNASGDVWVEAFDPGSVTRPEVTTPARGLLRWTTLKVTLISLWIATLAVIVGIIIKRRSD